MSNHRIVAAPNVPDSATIEVFEAIDTVRVLYQQHFALVQTGAFENEEVGELEPAVYAPAGFTLWKN